MPVWRVSLVSLPQKKYKCIYADPPWYFKSRSEKGEGRNPNKHYKCMEIQEICLMPVKDIADDDCMLLMWVVDPLLDLAFDVIEAWGFQYKTVGFTWAKQNKTNLGMFTGLGYWTRGNPEMCLLATKGRPKRKAMDVKQLIVEPRGKHSQKPLLHKEIERLVDGPYIELFARKKPYPNWDYWGNEV